MLLGVLSSLSLGWRVFLTWTGDLPLVANALLMDEQVPLGSGSNPDSSSRLPSFHSHNDYEHNLPLWDAFRHNVPSIEADIWLRDGQLLIGHYASDLTPDRTLASLYLEPLLVLLQAHNSSSHALSLGLPALDQPIQLLIDIKTDGSETFPHLYKALEPLRSAGLLSTYVPGTPRISKSLLTVIGTGNTQFADVASLGTNATHPRDVFLDAELSTLSTLPASVNGAPISTVAPLASTSFMHAIGFKHFLPFLARRRARQLIGEAHALGIQARFWSVPGWPRPLRMHIQRMLLKEGVDWVNTDDWREVWQLGGGKM